MGVERCEACHEDSGRFRGTREQHALHRANLRPTRYLRVSTVSDGDRIAVIAGFPRICHLQVSDSERVSSPSIIDLGDLTRFYRQGLPITFRIMVRLNYDQNQRNPLRMMIALGSITYSSGPIAVCDLNRASTQRFPCSLSAWRSSSSISAVARPGACATGTGARATSTLRDVWSRSRIPTGCGLVRTSGVATGTKRIGGGGA